MRSTINKPKANELSLSRFFAAPVSVVWDAWTDEKQVSQWWGPRGFTITTHSKDQKAGGHWHYTMHGPNGANYENRTKYFEFDKHKKMVYDHGGLNERKPLFRATVLFNEVPGGTRLDLTMAFASEEEAKQSRVFIKKAMGDSTWDRLGEYLIKQSENKEVFVINRSFQTSIENMWEMWTNPEHFSKWLAPTGFNMKFLKKDIRPGGTSSYSMTAENNSMTMYGTVSYVKLEKPHTLIYTQQFADEKGNVARHPMAPTWPETMQNTVKFTEEGPNQTRVTVQWEVIGKATAEEMDTFIKGRTGMTQGWTGSFDKLDALL